MPTYVYKFVKTGETFEVTQAFTDPALTEAKHPTTGRRMAVKKVFTPVGVTFRGDGFYKTDSRNSGGAKKPSTNGESTPSTSEKTDGAGGDATTTSPTKDAKETKAPADPKGTKKTKAPTSSN